MLKRISTCLFAGFLVIAFSCSNSDDSLMKSPTLVGEWEMSNVNNLTTVSSSQTGDPLSVRGCSTSDNSGFRPSGRIEFGESTGTFVNVSQCSVAAGWDFDWQLDQINSQILFTTKSMENIEWKILAFTSSELIIEWEEFNGIGSNQLHHKVTSVIAFTKK